MQRTLTSHHGVHSTASPARRKRTASAAGNQQQKRGEKKRKQSQPKYTKKNVAQPRKKDTSIQDYFPSQSSQ